MDTARMRAASIRRIVEDRRRRRFATERAIVTHIGPQPASDRLAAGQHRHRRVIAVDASARHHMHPDQGDQRGQRRTAGAHPVGQGQDVALNALAGKGPLPAVYLYQLFSSWRRVSRASLFSIKSPGVELTILKCLIASSLLPVSRRAIEK
jgi:hypothetical protein